LLIVATPFDASFAVAHTTITVPKLIVLSIITALAVRKKIELTALVKTPLFLSALCILVATAATLFVATYHGAVSRETLKSIYYLLAFCSAYWCYRADPDRQLLTMSICAITGIVAISAIAQEWTGAPSVFLTSHGTVARIAGPLEGPNQCAGFFDMTLTWLFAQTLFLKSVTQTALRRAVAAVIGLGSIALFLTFSRGGILATSVTIVALIVLLGAWKRLATLVWFVASICGLAIDIALAHGGAHLFSVTDSGDTGALGHRSELWRAALFFWKRHPLLGIGAGNYERELALAGYPKLHDHANSLYLQSLAEGGLVLFTAVVGFFITIAVTFARSIQSSPLAAGALAATLAFALHQSVDFLEFYPKIAMIWWIVLGVALADNTVSTYNASKVLE